MATIYPGNIPSLEQLKVGDKIRFSGKLTEQDPNIQKLFGQNAATWDVDPTTNKNIGITVQKPYVLPGTSYLPGVSPSDSNYWSINPDRLTPGDTSGDTTQNLGGLGSGGFYGSQAYNDLLKLINTPATTEPVMATSAYNVDADPNVNPLMQDYLNNIATISNEANAARQNVYDVGGRTTGTLKRLLGRAGGFTTTAGAQALTAQQNEIDANINKLNIAQQAALGAAKLAYQKGRSDIAANAIKKMQETKDALAVERQNKITNLLGLTKLQQEEAPKYTYNKDTGAYEYVSPDGQLKSIQVGTQKDLDPTNHFNSNGIEYVWSNKENKYVAAGGESKVEHSTAYKEWQDYKLSGGKLDFNAYQNMDANRKRASGSLVNIYNQKSVYDGGTIPANIKTDLLNDINVNKRTIEEVMSAYPEVDTAYIQSLYKNKLSNPFAN